MSGLLSLRTLSLSLSLVLAALALSASAEAATARVSTDDIVVVTLDDWGGYEGDGTEGDGYERGGLDPYGLCGSQLDSCETYCYAEYQLSAQARADAAILVDCELGCTDDFGACLDLYGR